jgi:hypothetical protein
MEMAEPDQELLQAMVQRVLDRQAEHSDEFREVSLRLASLQRWVLSIRGDRISSIDKPEQRLDIAG